ncbi:unnamed protein product, partial [Sphacelaria rigidula]
ESSVRKRRRKLDDLVTRHLLVRYMFPPHTSVGRFDQETPAFKQIVGRICAWDLRPPARRWRRPRPELTESGSGRCQVRVYMRQLRQEELRRTSSIGGQQVKERICGREKRVCFAHD